MKKYIIFTILFPSLFSQTLTLSSSNEFLVDEFNEAKDSVYALVVTGNEPGYIPAYWGSYRIRECFCSRDICHQVEAGHLLGLDIENFSMLKTFASDAPESNEYWPKWSYDFYGEPYFMDADFKELPAPFEIVEKIYEQYLWTGNPDWIWNDTLFTYCQNTITHFVNIHDENGNGIAETHTELATYWEQETDDFIEAGDSFANQYQAVLAFAGILRARGNITEADLYFEKAEELRNFHSVEWWDNLENQYIRGFDVDGNYKTDFGHENSFFMPLKRITDLGPKTKNYIEFCHKSIAYPNANEYTQWDFNTGINIEAKTYLPQMGYYNNRISIGWHWLQNLMNSNSTYPEVHFLIVGNIVCGMMGIIPDAPNQSIITLSKLNYEVSWVQADHIPLGENTISIRHDGQFKSTFINQFGPSLNWEAQFYGAHDNLMINGNLLDANFKSVNGTMVTFVNLSVSPGEIVIVEIPESPFFGEVFLSGLIWTNADAENGEVKRDVMSQGYAMAIDGKIYEKGLGVQGNSFIEYDLNGQFFRFTSDYGIDDSKTMGSAVFEIWADEEEIFNSGMIHSSNELGTVDINVSGVNQLILKTTDANSWDGICNWGNARLNTLESPILSVNYIEMSGDLNNNGEFDPGETGLVQLVVGNVGMESNSAWVECSIESDVPELILLETDSINVGNLEMNEVIEVTFQLSISPEIPRGSQFTLNFFLTDGENYAEDDHTFFIPAPELHLNLLNVENDENENGIPEPGEEFDFVFSVLNSGNFSSQELTVVSEATGENYEFLTINNPVVQLEPIESESQIEFFHSCSIASDTPRGTQLELTVEISDGEFGDTLVHTFTMPSPQLAMEYLGYGNDSNGNGILESGETAEITILIKNNGDGQTNTGAILCEIINENSEYIQVINSELELEIIEAETEMEIITLVEVNENTPGNIIFCLEWTYTDGIDTINLEKSVGTDVLWISDAFWEYLQNGWGEVHRDASIQGLPISLNGVVYEKGVGVHAISEIQLNLNGQFSRFVSDVGIDDEVSNGAGSVVFHVLMDGVEHFNSGYMDSDSPTQTVDLGANDVQMMTLLVSESTFGISSDHADWAGAHLTISSDIEWTYNFSSGWNLIGLPLQVENSEYSSLFPEADEGTLFGFDTTYFQSFFVENGIGYWLHFENTSNSIINGIPLETVTIDLNEGWNLVSGIYQSIYAHDIIDLHSLIIPGTIYTTTDLGYLESFTIEPGIGYWIRSSGEGEITLSSSAPLSKTKTFHPPENLNTLSLTNTTLYFGKDIPEKDVLSFSLPPKPPSGAKDIRFSGDTKLCLTDECVIEVMNGESPLRFECNLKDGEDWELIVESGNVFKCEGVQVLELDRISETFILRKSNSPTIPTEFALFPARPNPFNPITTLSYDLPEDNFVMLTVYDMLGREVTQLVNTTQEAGFKSVQWNATDSMGRPVSAGVYLYQIQAGDFVQTKKMVLLK